MNDYKDDKTVKTNQWFRFIACLFFISQCSADDYIQVYKKDVLHKFARFDEPTDHFAQYHFQGWENETFEVFDKVKDTQSIAIDLGAWIGTTSIWLSKNFHHVIAVEPDTRSLQCLQSNLEASACTNVSICNKPVSNLAHEVTFGSRGNHLNESMSFIKTNRDRESDYLIHSITLKQLIFDYIYANDALNSHKIGFIKCDIEGGEEDILEDLLHFAYNNKCKAYISFHLDWWKSKKISDFAYLFRFFKTNCPLKNISEYLRQNRFASLLFDPLDDAGVLVKNNLTALIIGYNQLTYIKTMVEQLEKYTSDIVIVDNSSDYQPLLDYYRNDYKYTLLRQKTNLGHDVYRDNSVQKLMGGIYILTDPDLKFNPKLPDTFIKDLIDISNYFGAYKVGFALCIDADDLRTDINFLNVEKPYWSTGLVYPPSLNIELYRAPLDTTFCLVNKRYIDHDPASNRWNHLRVAGDFTCIHRPWHRNFQNELQPGEYDSYLRDNKSSHYFHLRPSK